TCGRPPRRSRPYANAPMSRAGCREGLEDRRGPSVELDKKPAIGVHQVGPAPHLAPQNNQLMSEGPFSASSRLEARMARTARISAIITPTNRLPYIINAGRVFGTHSHAGNRAQC